MRQQLRVYADTSVYGGVFDDEFGHASQVFFWQVRRNRLALVTSEVVQGELALAPPPVRALANKLFPLMELIRVSQAAIDLQQAYIKEKIVTVKSEADAFHVA